MVSRLLPVLITLLALLPVATLAAPPAPALVEGMDYEVIPDGKPFAPAKGRIEVAEVFGYTCIHCAHLEPILATWKKTLPRDVKLTPVPAAFGGYWIPYARAFFAAQQLGVQERTHQAVFDALHKLMSDEDILELSYHTMAYNLHAVMCKALRLEFDDVPERIQEVPVPKDGKLAADWAGSAWAR